MKMMKKIFLFVIVLLVLASAAPSNNKPKQAKTNNNLKRRATSPEKTPANPPKCETAPKESIYDNVDHVFYGYHLIKGNPAENRGDPGIGTARLFKTCFNMNKKPGDNQYMMPDGLDVKDQPSCSTQTKLYSYTDEYSYQRMLSVDVTAKGTIEGIKFKASTGFENVSTSTTKTTGTNIAETARCAKYIATMVNDPIQFDDAFLNTLKKPQFKTPYDESQAQFYHTNLFDKYGTHCFSKVTMGTKFGKIKNVKGYSTSKSDSYEARLGGGVGAGDNEVEINSKFKTEAKKAFDSSTDEVNIFTIGGTPVSTLEEWERNNKDITKDFLPISYELKLLHECLKDVSFYGPIQLGKKVIKNIQTALENYCEHYYIKIEKKNAAFCQALAPRKIVPREQMKLFTKNEFYLIKNYESEKCIEEFGGDYDGFHADVPVKNCNNKNSYQPMAFEQPSDYFMIFFYSTKGYERKWRKLYLFVHGSRVVQDREVSDGSRQWTLFTHNGLHTYVLKGSNNQCLRPKDPRAEATNLIVAECNPENPLPIFQWELIPTSGYSY